MPKWNPDIVWNNYQNWICALRWLDLQDIVGSIDEENEGEEEEAEDQPDDGANEGGDQTANDQVLLIWIIPRKSSARN